MELCTGKKTAYKSVFRFRRVTTKVKRKIRFIPEGKVKEKHGNVESKYPFYLGGTDSCQGQIYKSYKFKLLLACF